jgi:2,5-diketo-D-gluconate reductase A
MRGDIGTLGTSLASGGTIPLLGFGTWRLEGKEAYEATLFALRAGYRHVDTATAYGNEERVGAALRDSGVSREEIFLTTKCPPERAGRERETLDASLKALGAGYVDLWLVHWPPEGEARPATWEKFIEAQQAGKARHIGVSNYSTGQIDELVEATGKAPDVNQIPWSPFLYDSKVAEEHSQRGVVLEGYSPLRRSRLSDPTLVEVAGAHGKKPAQVVLRWHIDHRFVAIPKSAQQERINENFDIGDFELSAEELRRLDALGG